MNKRIAIVANSTWNIYNFRLNIVSKLLNEGCQVIVIAPLDEYIKYKDKFPSVRHIELKHLQRDGKLPWKDIQLMMELRRIYKKLKPDLVLHYTHKPNIFGGFAARMAGVESIAVITGLGYAFLHKGMTNMITKFLYKISKNCHKYFVFENEDDLELFLKEGIMSKDQGRAVNGCGVDTKLYVPYPNGIVKTKTTFTFIGRLLYDKGIVEFVEAAKQIRRSHPSARFWIVGELDDRNPSMVSKKELLGWIDEGVVVFHGFQSDVRPLIAKSDCIVLPSYREGLPRIVLEGMAMAKPIITTQTAGCRQTIEEGVNGYKVEIQNSAALAGAMEKFLSLSHDQVHDMGQAGRDMVEEHFNSEKIAQDLYDIVTQA